MLPIVLVTGQLLTEAVWAPLIDRWPDRAVVLADHRKDDSIAGMATRLLAAAPARFALVGHAMGGFVAFEVMRRAPERVGKLVLMSTLAADDGPAQTARRQTYIDLVAQGRFAQVVEERIPILFPPDKRDDPALLECARAMAAATGAETFLTQQRAIMTRADSRPSLRAIRVPALIVWGDGDGITTRAQQDELRSGIPGAQFVVIPQAGHLVMIEHPVAVADALDRFL